MVAGEAEHGGLFSTTGCDMFVVNGAASEQVNQCDLLWPISLPRYED